MKYKHIALNLTFSPHFLCGPSSDTEATNESNERIARDTNDANIAMNKENNELQIRLQQEMNDFNSVVQQLERAKEAGVNPNAVISGSLNGNLQNSLPSTNAGHADPWRVENPYMERLSTIEQLRGSVNDFFQNMQTSSVTELSKQQSQAQAIENKYIDDLRSFGISIARGQAKKIEKEIDVLADQQQVYKKTALQIDSSIKNMNEDTRTKFLHNYFTDASNKGFIEYVRADLTKRGIPRQQQLSDDSILAIKYGAIAQYNLPLSQLQTEEIKRREMKANIGVMGALKSLYGAQTRNEYIRGNLDLMFGTTERIAGIEALDARASKDRQDARKQVQNYKIDNWRTSPEVQTNYVYGSALDNMQKEANITNTNMNTFKQGTEATRNIVGTASDVIDTFTPWAK